MNFVKLLYLLLLVAPLKCNLHNEHLISVIVLFRHGARAPTDKFSNESSATYFPNGLGEMTTAGIQGSYEMGQFLKRIYVDDHFLRHRLLPSQVYFRSRANSRCAMTASLVGRGMFGSGKADAAVPIFTQEEGDHLLNGDLDCGAYRERIYRTCGRYPDHEYPRFTDYIAFIYECLGLHKTGRVLRERHSFSMADSLINEYLNGVPMPKWFLENKDEIFDKFTQVNNFIDGSGEYHNPKILRLKCGLLLHTILDMLQSNWITFRDKGRLDEKKFVVYSTQDWLMQALMDAIGIRDKAIGHTLPKYNSMIILELRQVNGEPVVMAYYRDEGPYRVDVTSSIRGCQSYRKCPLDKVLNCCREYVTSDPVEECEAGKRSSERW